MEKLRLLKYEAEVAKTDPSLIALKRKANKEFNEAGKRQQAKGKSLHDEILGTNPKIRSDSVQFGGGKPPQTEAEKRIWIANAEPRDEEEQRVYSNALSKAKETSGPIPAMRARIAVRALRLDKFRKSGVFPDDLPGPALKGVKGILAKFLSPQPNTLSRIEHKGERIANANSKALERLDRRRRFMRSAQQPEKQKASAATRRRTDAGMKKKSAGRAPKIRVINR